MLHKRSGLCRVLKLVGEGAWGEAQTPPELEAPPCRPQLAVPEARPAAPPPRRPACVRGRTRAQSSARCPAMAARLLLRSLRVPSARSVPRPPPSAR